MQAAGLVLKWHWPRAPYGMAHVCRTPGVFSLVALGREMLRCVGSCDKLKSKLYVDSTLLVASNPL
jgi:hypothetical protein